MCRAWRRRCRSWRRRWPLSARSTAPPAWSSRRRSTRSTACRPSTRRRRVSAPGGGGVRWRHGTRAHARTHAASRPAGLCQVLLACRSSRAACVPRPQHASSSSSLHGIHDKASRWCSPLIKDRQSERVRQMSSQDLCRRWGGARAKAAARSACAILFHVWAGPPLARLGGGPSGGAGAVAKSSCLVGSLSGRRPMCPSHARRRG